MRCVLTTKDIAGVILAGGKSSRMGQDKATLSYKGKSLLQHIQEKFKEAGITDIYISGDEGVSDIVLDKGPLGGIYSVINQLPKNIKAILIAPVDMPLVSSDLLQKLFLERKGHTHFSGHIFPLILDVTEQVKDVLKKANNEDKSFSVKWFLSHLEISEIPLRKEEEYLFANANTPEEWTCITKEQL